MKLRQATREDFEAMFGHPPSRSFYGVVGEHDDGTLAGIGGVYYGAVHIAFCDLRVDPKTCKKELVKAARMVLGKMAERNVMVLALPDDVDTSERFLGHFGFKAYRGGWYRWNSSRQ